VLGVLDTGSANPDDVAVATQSAEAIRKLAAADYGIGIAAFPTDADGPDAHVYISIATPERTRRLRFGSATHPAIRQPLAAKRALNALRLILLGHEAGEA
jgi:hypothetical protein